jgi:cell wall assembly regulator SMI1
MNIRSFGQGNVKNIEKIEKELHVTLPEDYKNFLIKYNGAVIDDAYIYVEDLQQKMMMGLFYGVDLKNYADILITNKEFSIDLLENSLLIGTDDGEGWILLICDGENDGIWYYDHSYFFDQSTDDLNTYYICETFSDFIKLLETTTEE